VPEIVERNLTDIGIGGVAVVIAGVEAVGEARLCQQSFSPRGVVLWRRWLPVEVKIFRKYAASQMRMTKRESLVHRLAIEGQGYGLAHALIVPRRILVPLFGKIQPEWRRADRRLDAEARRALQLIGEFATDRIGNIDLATLQGR